MIPRRCSDARWSLQPYGDPRLEPGTAGQVRIGTQRIPSHECFRHFRTNDVGRLEHPRSTRALRALRAARSQDALSTDRFHSAALRLQSDSGRVLAESHPCPQACLRLWRAGGRPSLALRCRLGRHCPSRPVSSQGPASPTTERTRLRITCRRSRSTCGSATCKGCSRSGLGTATPDQRNSLSGASG